MKAYTLSEIRNKHYSGIVIMNLLTLAEVEANQVSINKIVLVNSIDLFNEIITLGEKIDNIHSSKEENAIEQSIQISKKWIDDNYYPYSPNRFYEYGEWTTKIFSDEIYKVYLIFQLAHILKSIVQHKTISSNTKDQIKQLTQRLDIHTIIFNHWNENCGLSIDDFLDLIDTVQITEDNKDLFSSILLNILINYVFSFLNVADYMIKDSIPLPKTTDISKCKYYFYKYSNCIMGLIYYELLNSLVSDKGSTIMDECISCKQLYIKHSNHQSYCENCSSLGIPNKEKNKRYNESKKGKARRKQYYEEKKKKQSVSP